MVNAKVSKLRSGKSASAREAGGRWLIPGEAAWEIRDAQLAMDSSVESVEDIATAKPTEVTLVALPPQLVICQLFWLETTDEKSVPDLVRMQCERHSLLHRGEVWTFRILRQEAERSLVQVLILQEPLPSGLQVDAPETRYEALPRCLRMEPQSLYLWRTLGFVILAMTDAQGSPVYFQALPHTALSRACRLDVQAVLCMVVAQNWAPLPTTLYLCGVWNSPDVEEAKLLGLPLCLAGELEFALPLEAMNLTPHSVQQLRILHRRRFRFRMAALGVGLIYAAFLTFNILSAAFASASHARLQKQLDAVLPEMTRLQRVAMRMEALTPALDTKTYPLEILYRIMAVLPESGVRLTRFEIVNDRLEIAGESSTAREAFDFLHAVETSDSLQYIEWEAPPQPVPLPNDTVRFSIQGTIAGAYHDVKES